jgi:serine/threonine protein phosphatase PrpC
MVMMMALVVVMIPSAHAVGPAGQTNPSLAALLACLLTRSPVSLIISRHQSARQEQKRQRGSVRIFCFVSGSPPRSPPRSPPTPITHRYCMVCLDAQQEERNKQQQHQFMVGVFDGHCGAGAAEEAMEAIQEEVRDLVRDVNDTEAFVRAFLATDDRIQDEAGCTATCVTIFQHDQGGEIEIRAANVGDSMAYMASIDRDEDEVDVDDKKSIDIYTTLTQDHRLSNPEERGRLQSHGVIPEGESTTYRLYGLNLARALGDRFLKDEDLGLSAEPHVSDAITLGGDQEALIVIASDGLWDVMSADDAMDLARQVDRDSHGGVVKVASALVREAEALGSKDDVTVVACRVWSNEATANFSRAFGSGLDGLGRVDGHVDLDKGARGRRAASKADDVSDVDDDLAVGFGGMLL